MTPLPPKRILLKQENVLVIIRHASSVNILAYAAALQGYVADAKQKHAAWCSMMHFGSDYKLTLWVRFEHVSAFCAEVLLKLVPELQIEQPAMSYDAIFDLSTNRVFALGKTLHKPFSHLLGILLGCESKLFPTNVEILCPLYTKQNYILGMPIYSKECEFISSDPTQEIEQVFECRGVYAWAGFATYLAAALHKPVIEICGDPLLWKFSYPQYCVMTDYNQKAMQRAIDVCFPISDRNLKTATVP